MADLPNTLFTICASHLPIDRRIAVANGEELPTRSSGTALFADLSGYTHLSAELTQHLGAEAGVALLAHTLNKIYNSLIGQVHRFGGVVLTFAGDAITCWFPADVGERAIACAQRMQRDMQPFGRLVTPSGASVPLQIKISIASGKGRRLVIGDPKYKQFDILIGSVLDKVAIGNKSADRGETIVTESILKRLELENKVKRWRVVEGVRYGVIRFSTHSLEVAPWPEIDGENRDPIIWKPWLLDMNYERLVAGQSDYLPEIRPVGAIFVRFYGFDYQYDPKIELKLNQYISAVQEIIHRFGGHLLQIIFGDKGSFFYASFGTPSSHTHDDLRIVLAALSLRNLQKRFKDLDQQQIGISYGPMYAGPYGSPSRQTFGIIGPEANVAARLMLEAKNGQILIPQTLASQLNERIWLQYLGFTYIQGLRRSIKLFNVLDRIPNLPSQLLKRYARPPQGRKGELKQISQTWHNTANSPGAYITLLGESGSGKSHIAHTLAKKGERYSMQSNFIGCHNWSPNPVYAPWRRVVLQYLNLPFFEEGYSSREKPQIENQIRSKIAAEEGIKADQALLTDFLLNNNRALEKIHPLQLAEPIFQLIQNRAQDQRLLLIFENAHWMDSRSVALASILRPRLTLLPLTVIFCLRPTKEAQQMIESLKAPLNIRLNPLLPQDIKSLIESSIGYTVADDLHQVVMQQSAGNPAFVHAIVRQMRKHNQIQLSQRGEWILAPDLKETLLLSGVAELNGEGEQFKLIQEKSIPTKLIERPDKMTAAYLAKLDQLPHMERLLLRLASAIGQQFSTHQIETGYSFFTEERTLVEAVNNLIRLGFLIKFNEDGNNLTVGFAAPLMRDILYDSLYMLSS